MIFAHLFNVFISFVDHKVSIFFCYFFGTLEIAISVGTHKSNTESNIEYMF